MNKTALVLEGGGLRGIFTSGVMDCFLDFDMSFPYVIGVSAGACNALSFLGKKRGYFKTCLFQEDKSDSFYGVQQMLESHRLIDLDKVFYDYTKKYKFDFDLFLNSPSKWNMVVSNIETGKAEYMCSDDPEKIRIIGKASCSLPIITDPVEIDGNLYLDGGVCDPIPIKYALDQGYEKAVVVLTRKKGHYSVTSEATKIIARRLYDDYPKFVDALIERTRIYKEAVDFCEKLEKEGKVVIIRPTMDEVGRLESDENQLSLAYYHGYTKAKELINKIKEMEN